MANLINGLGGAAGFGENSLPRGDDNSSGAINLNSLFPSGLNFFGTVYNDVYVNNNGDLTFGGGSGTFSFNFTSAGDPVIAPFRYDALTTARLVAANPRGTST